MRASRRTVVVLLLGAALAMAPAALSASSWRGQPPPVLGALDQAWQLVGRLAGWFGWSQVDEGGSMDPNGKANHKRLHSKTGRPVSGVSPHEGGSADPNGS